ncbi:site-specific integrase [Halorhodospira sp. 9622]|uniref:tyrosine-type recombinase/integrase n=1 Tax=Halorhodospira sp. 9622 TaxID=2899136 RepID=UPI001EE7DF5F|nr:tyrosine-type recombinase/integrase [Halorhodospira sp. 9622]
MSTSLTESHLKALTPPERGRRLLFDEHRDAPRGFGVRITPKGSVAFVLRYTNSFGKDRLVTIGEHGTWTLSAARKRAAELRKEIDTGADPLDRRRTERSEPTVAEVAEQFCKDHVDSLRSSKEVRRLFNLHIVPALGTLRLKDVRRADVIGLVSHIASDRGRQASLVLQYTKSMFAWAEDRELIELNPIATLKASKIGKELAPRRRQRVLDRDELKALWNATPSCGIQWITLSALWMILLTGQRPGEVAAAEWSEINFREKNWVIPETRRRKTETDQTVPLTPLMLDLLGKIEEWAAGKRSGRYVFEVVYGRSLDPKTPSRAVFNATNALGNKVHPTWGHWTPHDLRRTARTGMARAGVDETVAELAIGHTRKGIVAVYDQHRYEDEKRRALEAWEHNLLEQIK